MDWSLVLASQAIECQPDVAEDGWGLWVDAAVEERARGVLRQYRLENRRWFLLRRPEPGTISWSFWAFAWVIVLTLFHYAQTRYPAVINGRGMMDANAVLLGEWWRPITAVSLHADIQHLLGNLTFGGLLLGLAMHLQGRGWALLLALIGGVIGNMTSLLVHGPAHLSLGASGMVMAALGLLAAGAASSRSRHGAGFWIVRSLVGACFLFLLLGVDPRSDITAHLGGFVAGIGLGWLARSLPLRIRHGALANALAAALAVVILTLAWLAALA